MQLITEEYCKLNAQLHAENKNYGTSGQHYVKDIIGILKNLQTQDLLDYGCGKSTLANNLPFTIKQYDPAVPKHSALPQPADVVVCTDVLEHIEPECIQDVIKHLSQLTKKICYLTVAIIPAQKTLPDGRNAHLLVKPYSWWVGLLEQYFDFQSMICNKMQFVMVLTPKEKEMLQ